MATFDPVLLAATVWRAVEAQHRVATTALTDTLAEQAQLERILESTKPDLPAEAAGLHWLLFTPFCYPPLPQGSRFRGPYDPGVFYAAFEQRTACAELGFWRWRFLMDAPALTRLDQRAHTVFSVTVAGPGIDLRAPPWADRRARWTHPADYSACQQLAREARTAGVAAISYESVRDPGPGGCVALLSAAGFGAAAPDAVQTWYLWVDQDRVRWRLDSPFADDGFQFDTAPWAAQMAAAVPLRQRRNLSGPMP